MTITFDDNGNAVAHNMMYNTYPLVLHGNGLAKLRVNQLGNYVGRAYNNLTGCIDCVKDVATE